MLTPRPDKFRGGRAYASVGINAGTTSAVILFPPSSGLVLKRFSQSGMRVAILPISGFPAFTSGLAVVSLNVYPSWGPDYPPTARVEAGQFASQPIDFFSANAHSNTVIDETVFPPNVVAVFATGIATAIDGSGFSWEEFLSAEELQRWHTARPL